MTCFHLGTKIICLGLGNDHGLIMTLDKGNTQLVGSLYRHHSRGKGNEEDIDKRSQGDKRATAQAISGWLLVVGENLLLNKALLDRFSASQFPAPRQMRSIISFLVLHFRLLRNARVKAQLKSVKVDCCPKPHWCQAV